MTVLQFNKPGPKPEPPRTSFEMVMPLENSTELQRTVRVARETLLAFGLRFAPATPYVMPVIDREGIANLQDHYRWAYTPSDAVACLNHPRFFLNTGTSNRAVNTGIFAKPELDETGNQTYTLGAIFGCALLNMHTETVNRMYGKIGMGPVKYPVGAVPLFSGIPEESIECSNEALRDALLVQRPSITFGTLTPR